MSRAKEMRELPLAIDVTASGNVGIGTTGPDGKLNVVSTAHNNGAIFDSTGTTQLWLRDTDATSNQRNWGIQVSGGDFNIIRANDDRASGFVTPIYMQQAPSNSLVINSSGQVGFGTTSPSDYYAKDLVVNAADEGGITIVNGTTEQGYLMFADGTGGSPDARFRGYIGYDHNIEHMQMTSGGILKFLVNNTTQAMTVDTSGRLTIGSVGTDTTLSGGQPALQVTGSAFNGYMASVRRDSSQYASGIILAKSRSSTADNFTVLQDNDGIGGVIFIGDDGTDLDTYGATITAVVNGTPSNNNMPADLEFATNSGTSSPTLNMKLTKDGVLEGASDSEIKTSPIRIHSNTISTNTTVASTENAVSGGPVTIASGVTVTVSGDWTVV